MFMAFNQSSSAKEGFKFFVVEFRSIGESSSESSFIPESVAPTGVEEDKDSGRGVLRLNKLR